MSENLHELVSDLIVDTKGSATELVTADSSLAAFGPELVLCATIVVMLIFRIFITGRAAYIAAFLIALSGSCFALWLAAPWTHLASIAVDHASPVAVTRMEIFTGMLVYDTFSVYIRAVLLCFVVLFLLFTQLSGLANRDDRFDFYTLLLGSTLGMCLMASANHLLMIFVAVEMASVPSYALAGLMKGRRVASEAALKYAVYGAGAAGVMLYGISLVAGLLNTAHLPTMAIRLAEYLGEGPVGGADTMVLALGGLMIMVGLAFKLSAVPFHFWCPDVFEGATAEINAFLSVASKAAALALLVRVALGFGVVPTPSVEVSQVAAMDQESLPNEAYFKPGARSLYHAKFPSAPAADSSADEETAQRNEATSTPFVMVSTSDEELDVPQDAMSSLSPVRMFIAKVIALFAVITCTFGNLAAYGQTNIKRLMAYSTIAHAGYMMMPVPVIMVMAGHDVSIAESAVSALCIYIAVYLFMNLGAFAVIAFLGKAMRSDEIADYSGLIRRCPFLVICLSLIMFSLIGMPPLAGFVGKFAIFASLADGWRSATAADIPATFLLVLLLVGGVNTAISLFYYLRVVKTMTLDPEPEGREPFVGPDIFQRGFVLLMAGATIVLFIAWDWLSGIGQVAAHHLFPLS